MNGQTSIKRKSMAMDAPVSIPLICFPEESCQQRNGLCVPPEGFPYDKPCTVSKMPGEAMPMIPSWKRQACNMHGKSEACELFSSPSSWNLCTEQAQDGLGRHGQETFSKISHFEATNMPMKMLQPEVQLNIFSGGWRRNEFSQEPSTCELSGEEQCIHVSVNEVRHEYSCMQKASSVAPVSEYSCMQKASSVAPVCTELNQTSKVLQDEVQDKSGPSDIKLSDMSERLEQGVSEVEVKNSEIDDTKNVKKELGTNDNENPKCLLVDYSSKMTVTPSSAVDHALKSDPSVDSLKLDGRNRVKSGKVSHVIGEKLWVGSLQLNSSVCVSTVAFFKSGEKMCDINWPDSVEVKGKVRLDAFEKYIQDLPRSRNRGLMVVSLRWREGSSVAGLKGMKGISQGYRKGERVGLAQVLPGIDLYICPRSSAIITILAKHGFYKGMAAVEKNNDSLIGCLVWKKNRLSSTSFDNKAESKNNSSREQPPDSSSAQQLTEKSTSVQRAEVPMPLLSGPSSSAIEGETKFSINDNYGSRLVPRKVCEGMYGANHLPSLSIPSTSVEQPKCTISCSSAPFTKGSLLGAQISDALHSGEERSRASFESQKSQSLPRIAVRRSPSEEDDLPEFDFGVACGISQAPAFPTSDATSHDKKFSVGSINHTNVSVLPKGSIAHALSVSNFRVDNPSLPRIPFTCPDTLPEIYIDSRTKEKHVLSEINRVVLAASASSNNCFREAPKKKNLFDHDDDIPDWCPDDPQRQSFAGEIHQLRQFSPQFLNSNFRNRLPTPSWHVQPSAYPSMAPRPTGFPVSNPTYHCPTSTSLKPPEPMPFNGSSSSKKIIHDPHHRFPPSFRPAVRKG